MTSISEAAPAKINLSLAVLGRRQDGFHELSSLVVFARDIADHVTMTPGAEYGVTFSGPFAQTLGAGIAGRDSISEGFRQLAARIPKLATLGTVHVVKQIPVAAGLGGGSADAGAFLRVVARLNPNIANDTVMLDIARRIGADVPVCFINTSAVMTGLGEQLTMVPGMPTIAAVLVNPLQDPVPNKTRLVFEHLGAQALQDSPAEAHSVTDLEFHSVADVVDYIALNGNALEVPARALMPEIGDAMAALRQTASCLSVGMSGAGPTVFGLFGSEASAQAAAEGLRRAAPGWWIAVSKLS